MNRLNPILLLNARNRNLRKTCALAAHTADELQAWQSTAHKALASTLAIDDLERTPLRPRIVEEIDRGTHLQRKVLLRSTPYSDVPVYMLIPKGNAVARPCVLALHGHGYGVKAILGITEDGQYRDEPGGYQQDFAVELVKRGFVVAAPEISCFGEREVPYDHLPDSSSPPFELPQRGDLRHDAGHDCGGDARLGRSARRGLSRIDARSRHRSARRHGDFRRWHACLLLRLHRPAHPGCRHQRLFLRLEQGHPFHQPLHLQFRARPA